MHVQIWFSGCNKSRKATISVFLIKITLVCYKRNDEEKDHLTLIRNVTENWQYLYYSTNNIMRQEINPKIMRASITLLTDGVSLHNNKAKMIWSPFLLLNGFQWNSCMGVLNCSWATEDIRSSPLVCVLQIYLHISILAKINRITMFSTNIILCSTWISFIKIKLSTKLKKMTDFFAAFPQFLCFTVLLCKSGIISKIHCS